jgi:DNA polymerase I-like protein with 3'-5' exonuclease and polymerase domains
VHDSIVVDIKSGEVEDVGKALQWAMNGVDEELQQRFGYQTVLPLDTEYSVGSNWMNMEEISVD